MERQIAAVIAILAGLALALGRDDLRIEQVGVIEPALVDGFDDVSLEADRSDADPDVDGT